MRNKILLTAGLLLSVTACDQAGSGYPNSSYGSTGYNNQPTRSGYGQSYSQPSSGYYNQPTYSSQRPSYYQQQPTYYQQQPTYYPQRQNYY